MAGLSLGVVFGKPINGVLVALAVLTALASLVEGATGRKQVTEHPFIEQKDIKSETCLTCHSDKKEGKFVHSAIAMGCENCHQATSEKEKTTIAPVATGAELCGMCHEAKKDPILHSPYEGGRCLVCHDPHASDFIRQLRAETNRLCMNCHGADGVNANVIEGAKLSAPQGDQTLSGETRTQASRIGLDSGGKSGHPVMGHPLTGKDPRKEGESLTCLSCHAPHSSVLPRLLPGDPKNPVDLCGQCHR